MILVGRINEMRARDGRFQVQWRPRGKIDASELSIDRIINTTGPDFDVRRLRDPLWSALLRRGLAAPDALGLGVCTSNRGAMLDASAKPVGELYYLVRCCARNVGKRRQWPNCSRRVRGRSSYGPCVTRRVACAEIAVSIPCRIRSGEGGQPGTTTSTGMTFDTRPQLA